ncbi:hypothetical protein V6N13_070560 [Hibiscus sabdariffa]|uniref:Secreted protein n=1 Tax=Hibiscus sabdariffa TaxID=183260 RepID=A0ABR2TGK4_9ROSI
MLSQDNIVIIFTSLSCQVSLVLLLKMVYSFIIVVVAAACMVQPERVSGMRCCSKMGSQRVVFVAVTCSKLSHSRGRCYGGVSADQTGFGTCFSDDVRSQSFR